VGNSGGGESNRILLGGGGGREEVEGKLCGEEDREGRVLRGSKVGVAGGEDMRSWTATEGYQARVERIRA
jgi:hypothetical protein